MPCRLPICSEPVRLPKSLPLIYPGNLFQRSFSVKEISVFSVTYLMTKLWLSGPTKLPSSLITKIRNGTGWRGNRYMMCTNALRISLISSIPNIVNKMYFWWHTREFYTLSYGIISNSSRPGRGPKSHIRPLRFWRKKQTGTSWLSLIKYKGEVCKSMNF